MLFPKTPIPIIATPITTNVANSPHDSAKFTAPYPPISLKSNSTCQSNTDAENAETASPANATHVRRIVRPTQSASAMNASHAPPTNAPISASSVRCELTSVRTVIPSGSMNADAISPDFPNPTPSRFAAKSLSPASHIFGLFITAPSSANLGHIHHAAITSTDNAIAMVGTAFHRRPRHNIAASITNTTNPVREYVMASITQSAAPMSRPTHRHPPRHPQQNGNSAQIAAAA